MPPTTDNSSESPPTPHPSQAFMFTKIPLAPTSLVVEEMEGLELQRGGGWGLEAEDS